MGTMDSIFRQVLKMGSKKAGVAIDKVISGSNYIVDCPYCGKRNGIVDNPCVLICQKCNKHSIFDTERKIQYACKCTSSTEPWKGLWEESGFCDNCRSRNVKIGTNIESITGMKFIPRWK